MLHRFEFMTENLKNGLKPHPKWLLFRNVSILGNTRWMKQIGWMKHINGWEGQMGQKKQVGGMGQMGRRGWRMGYAEKETKKWWCLTWKLSFLVHSLQSDKNSSISGRKKRLSQTSVMYSALFGKRNCNGGATGPDWWKQRWNTICFLNCSSLIFQRNILLALKLESAEGPRWQTVKKRGRAWLNEYQGSKHVKRLRSVHLMRCNHLS